jgi:hypothetical protein
VRVDVVGGSRNTLALLPVIDKLPRFRPGCLFDTTFLPHYSSFSSASLSFFVVGRVLNSGNTHQKHPVLVVPMFEWIAS